MDKVKARYRREYELSTKQMEFLLNERKDVARKLSQSALDVAYKGWNLNMRLVHSLIEIEEQMEYTQKKIDLFSAKM